jgi:hypothetical protein
VTGTHDKITADAAKRALQPLGFRRKGQSRLWLADHDWWLAVVEFQPSGFRKGSYLNVAAHWLWSNGGYITFDFGCGANWGSRVAEFEEYETDEQFRSAADRLAATAAEEAQQLARRLSSIRAAAELLVNRENSSSPQSRGSWPTYHAGVAAGLADRGQDAHALLRSVSDERVKSAAKSLLECAGVAGAFKAAASSLIATQRQALHLPVIDAVEF